MAAIALTVEFLADGRCVTHAVTSSGQNVSSDGPSSGGMRAAADPAGSGFHCPIPFASLGGSPVTLRVLLPSNAAPSLDSFPLLTWQDDYAGWVGTAALPSAPSFVSLHRSNGAAATSGSFGWNFYGFFVFATVFIAAYFGWAKRMQRAGR